jgi:uncharacterized repeat protein (TIGR03803 family)
VTNTLQRSISKMRLGAAGATLPLAVVVLLGIVATHSAQAQTFTVLYSFSGGDGGSPYGSLVRDAAGTLYGTTLGGGLNFAGVVFKVTTSGKEKVLHNFGSSNDGKSPQAGLIRDSAGNLYGTTQYGGAYNNGTVFRVSGAGQEKVLLSFFSSDGEKPLAALVRDSSGNLYGTAYDGGNYGYGSVFKLAPNGRLTVASQLQCGPEASRRAVSLRWPGA